ncbi:unnamed protein product, partial [Symbiodinium microadriaticum]
MGRAHYRPDGTRRRTSGELAARAKKKARREQEAAAAAAAASAAARPAAPPEEAEPDLIWPDQKDGEDVEEEEVEIEVEVEAEVEEPPVYHRPKVRLRPALVTTLDRELDGEIVRGLPVVWQSHKAVEEGLPLREDGFFEDAKKRYTLRHFDGVPWVRAAQGHSQAVRKDLVMRRLHRQELPPYLYHGTRAGNYRSILRSGLLAGGPSGCRTDIQLVEHLPDSGQRVLSGWRSNCELAIQVTPQAASSSGCTFYYSDNEVYLTEGVRGAIAPQFISAVVILQSGEVITSPRAGTAPSGEAVAAGLRRAREARGGYTCAVFVALLCQWPLLTLVPYWCAQAAADTLVWYPQLPAQAHCQMADGVDGGILTSCLSDDESEDYPPPPAPTAPNVSTQPARETSARGIPVGSLLSRALRREHYAPEILRVVEPALDPVRSDTTADRNDFDAADVMTTKPGVAATALIEAPTDTTPAPQAPDRPPQMNWAENEAFQFHPEAHCLSTVPSASPHPEGMQYGPARRSSRACAKMLVRAGHRCPACLVVTLLVLAKGMPTHHFVFLRLLNSSSTSGLISILFEEATETLPPSTREQEKPVTEQALLPTAPSGEPSRLDASQLPPEPPVTTLEGMLGDIRETEVATMLNLFQQAGHYTSQHGPFHDLRDSLLRDQVCGPNGEPLPLPPVGNWILALGISLLGFDTPAGHALLSRITNHQTAGDLIEAWALQLWNRGYRSLCAQLSGYFLLLHNLLADVPPRVYSALGQEWRITWIEFRAVVRAWIGDPPAPTMLAITQASETGAEQRRFGRLSETLRARSLSPGDGPLLGSRASFLDSATDASVIPSILLPYTFPAFQVGSALPL